MEENRHQGEEGKDPMDDDVIPPTIFCPRDPLTEHCRVGDMSIEFSPKDDMKPNQQLLDFLNIDEGSFTEDRALTNGEKMFIENNGESFDITSRRCDNYAA